MAVNPRMLPLLFNHGQIMSMRKLPTSRFCQNRQFAWEKRPLPIFPRKSRGVENIETAKFVDHRRVVCRGGDGGRGAISFRREKFVSHGGPDGGNGGCGGHVVFKVGKSVRALNQLPRKLNAIHGFMGDQKDKDGTNAPDLVVEVPVGTQIQTVVSDDHEAGLCSTVKCWELLKEDSVFLGAFINSLRFGVPLRCDTNKKVTAARGGTGGQGNKQYATALDQMPLRAQSGAVGECRAYDVQLKILAHAGLVGFPNSGKSTLLRAMSRAAPKVASYPFTTLKPHVGVVHYDDFETLRVADIPGIIRDSHLDKGLGVGFLRHIERCLCVFYVLDASAQTEGGSLHQQLIDLRHELNCYQEGLGDRQNVIIANKIDIDGSRERCRQLEAQLRASGEDYELFLTSGATGQGLTSLLLRLREMYESSMANQ